MDIDAWFFRMVVLLGFREQEFWHMTTRKAVALFDSYLKWHGLKKEESVKLADIFGGD